MFSVIVSAGLFLAQGVPFVHFAIGIGLMCSGNSGHCGG